MTVAVRRVDAERGGRQAVEQQVDQQDLQHGQRRAEPEEHGEREREHLAGVAGEEEVREAHDVVVDRAALADRADDRRVVVVGEDHVGRLAGGVGAAPPHGDADVCCLERRDVVDAIAGHGGDLAVALERLDDPDLVLGHDAREDVDVADGVAQRVVARAVELRGR